MLFRTLFAFIVTPLILSAQILEIEEFSEILSHLEEGTLVIFDIDNTLIEPVQLLGSDQWFEHRIGYYHNQGHHIDEAIMHALYESEAVQALTKVQLVEEETAALIETIQMQGYKTMGLTSRNFCFSDVTQRQLKSVNIDLIKSSYFPGYYYYEKHGRGILFRKGILFCTGTNKGEAFSDFFNYSEEKPKRIVFIDDKKSSLLHVEQAAKQLGVSFTGLRYSYLDEKVKELDEQIAHLQWEHFKHVLSDEEAYELVK